MQEFTYADGVLTRARTFALPAVTGETFAGGLAISPDGKTLYVTRVFAQTLSSIDLVERPGRQDRLAAGRAVHLRRSRPTEAAVRLAVGRRAVSGVRRRVAAAVDDFDTGEHPNAMLLSPDGKRLFVACGNSATVWVFDTFPASRSSRSR